MTSPGYVPGSVPPNNGNTEQRLRDLEKRIDAITRKDLSRANIGQGGRLRGQYSNGSESILFGVDPEDGRNKAQIKYSDGNNAFSVSPGNEAFGSLEHLVMWDQSRNVFLSTDELIGYGLSNPTLALPVWGREELQPGANAGAAVAMAEGRNFVYNPVVHMQIRVRCAHSAAGTTNLSMFLEVVDQSANVLATSSTQTESVTGVVFSVKTFERQVVLPESAMGRLCTIRMRVHSPTPANYGVTAYPMMCIGTSKSWYDIFPALH